MTRRLLERFVQASPSADAGRDRQVGQLTEREREVLKLVAQGLSNREIAERLVLAEPTVKTHVSHLLLKLDLRDRAQLVVLAYESGIVRPGLPAPPGPSATRRARPGDSASSGHLAKGQRQLAGSGDLGPDRQREPAHPARAGRSGGPRCRGARRRPATRAFSGPATVLST